MKLLLGILSFVSVKSFAGDIVISKDTTVNNTWTIPSTTIIRFETGGHISGSGIISGGVINASYLQNIFDTTLTVAPYGLYSRDFSARWFGMNPSATPATNRRALQKTINTCMSTFPVFVPRGAYTLDTSIFIGGLYNGDYVGVTLHLFGEANFWAPEVGTSLIFNNRSGNGIGIQQGKGVEIDHINLKGKWTSPAIYDSAFYKCTYANYTDPTVGQYYFGINIDPLPNPSGSSSGSTGIHIHEVNIENFTCLIAVSLTSWNGSYSTLNGDILLFENIHFGDAKAGFISSQGQEKGNVIRGLYSWGTIHTLFSSGNENNHDAGNYTIDGGNIAGGCNRLFNINQSSWGDIHISNLFAEQIGSIGTLTTARNIFVESCTFHFAYPAQTGYRPVLLTSSGKEVMFQKCKFEYFGGSGDAMNFVGTITDVNNYWSNALVNPSIKYQVQGVKLNIKQ